MSDENKERTVRDELRHAFDDQSGREMRAEDQLRDGERFLHDEYNIQRQNDDKGERATEETETKKADETDASKYEDNRYGAKEGDGKEAEKEGAETKKKEDPADLEAPVKWTKEEKEAFDLAASFGDEAKGWATRLQEIIHSRNKGIEGEFTKRMQAMAKERADFESTAAKYNAIEEVLQPRRDQWAREGVDDVTAIRQLVALNDYAVSNPVDFVKWFMQGRGLSAEQIGIQPPEAQPQRVVRIVDLDGNTVDEFIDSQSAQQPQQQAQQHAELPPHVQQRISGLEQQLQQQQRAMQHAQQAAQQRNAQQAQDAVAEFAAETDQNGNPLRPFFEEVRGTMSNLVTADPNLTLQQAYDAAVYADAGLRQKLEESAQMRFKREQEAAAKAASQQSRMAAASLPTGQSTGAMPAPTNDLAKMSLREQLNTIYDQQSTRDQGRV